MRRMKSQQIQIEKRTFSAGLARGILILPLFYAALVELLHLPGVIRFVSDMLLVCIAAVPVLGGKLKIRRSLAPFAVLVLIFAMDTLLVYLFNYQSIFYYLWGFRNNFRFFVAFFAFASYFSEEDGNWCLTCLDRFFWLNAVLCLIQFLMGNEQDMIGGVFGASKGCNGYMIVYLSIVISKSLLAYMSGEESAVRCFYKSAVALFLSAIAELKFFFFMYVVILVLAACLTSFSLRKMVLFGVGSILLAGTAAVLGTLYSYFQGFFSLSNLLAVFTQKNYASDIDMGRFSAIPFISQQFLTDIPSRIFGMGLGNCDTSSIPIFNTPFSDAYVDLHYSIFSYAFMFVENGYVGLALYALFFVLSSCYSLKRFRRREGSRLFCQMAIIIGFMCFALLFYNSSLRTEAGYMIYFVLALPFIETDKEKIEDF